MVSELPSLEMAYTETEVPLYSPRTAMTFRFPVEMPEVRTPPTAIQASA